MTSVLIFGFVIIAVIIAFYSCKGKAKTTDNQENAQVKKTEVKDNSYQGLRERAISVTPEQLQLHLDRDNDLYGMVMDWNMGNAIVTVVSFNTGDASVYLSSGQAFIGGYAHESVANAAKEFVKAGKKYLSKATKTDLNQPTKEKKVDFYFLTKTGKYYLEDDLDRIENNKSDLTALFGAANQVITDYRLITDKK